jgi:hypothetical protein
MVNSRHDYEPHVIQAARRVLLELAKIFEDELDHIVFVGGTACALLFSQETDPHEETIDVDVVLNPAGLADETGDTLEDKLNHALYQQVEGRSYRWDRRFRLDGNAASVLVDILTGESEDASQPWRSIQGLHASVLRGMSLAFLDPRRVEVEGELPDGRRHRSEIQICSAASLLAMKGISILERKEGADKDAVDIDYVLRRYAGGYLALARVFQTVHYAENDLANEGLRRIDKAFASFDSLGPVSVASPFRYSNDEESAIVQQGAFQRVRRFLRELGFG